MIENIGAYSQVDYDRGYSQGRADMKAEYESADIPLIHGKEELAEHDKQIRADAIKPFEDIYIKNIALDYERPTMPMLMNFWNEFSKLTNEQLKKMNKRGD